MRNEKRRMKGILAVSFGLGLFISSICSTKLLIIVLSFAVVTLGISCTKC